MPTAEPAEKHALHELLSACRTDPTTSLCAFTDFMPVLPQLVKSCSTSDNRAIGVGVAVGDVDGLKSLIEAPPDHADDLIGHLRGNRFMSSLGSIADALVKRLGVSQAALATFGGDEIVVVMSAPCPMSFVAYLNTMRQVVSTSLPRTLSFAWTWLPGNSALVRHGAAADFDRLLMDLDLIMIDRKRARRSRLDGSFCQPVRILGEVVH